MLPYVYIPHCKHCGGPSTLITQSTTQVPNKPGHYFVKGRCARTGKPLSTIRKQRN